MTDKGKQLTVKVSVHASDKGDKGVPKLPGKATPEPVAAPAPEPKRSKTMASTMKKTGAGHMEFDRSFIVCSHLADQMDIETVKSIALKFGIDLDRTPKERKIMEKEMKKKLKAWEKCPNRLDFSEVCVDPVTNQLCPVVQSLLSPLSPESNPLNCMPPGTLCVGRRQVAFNTSTGATPSTNDPYQLELGRRADGTMCVSVRYAPDPRPPPEFICTTPRETQAVDDAKPDKGAKKSVGKKSAKPKKK